MFLPGANVHCWEVLVPGRLAKKVRPHPLPLPELRVEPELEDAGGDGDVKNEGGNEDVVNDEDDEDEDEGDEDCDEDEDVEDEDRM